MYCKKFQGFSFCIHVVSKVAIHTGPMEGTEDAKIKASSAVNLELSIKPSIGQNIALQAFSSFTPIISAFLVHLSNPLNKQTKKGCVSWKWILMIFVWPQHDLHSWLGDKISGNTKCSKDCNLCVGLLSQSRCCSTTWNVHSTIPMVYKT